MGSQLRGRRSTTAQGCVAGRHSQGNFRKYLSRTACRDTVSGNAYLLSAFAGLENSRKIRPFARFNATVAIISDEERVTRALNSVRWIRRPCIDIIRTAPRS